MPIHCFCKRLNHACDHARPVEILTPEAKQARLDNEPTPNQDNDD